jgi:sodium/bile acid cotransporter 7
MAQLLFADRSDIGLILLPLMLYHPLQLLVGGVLVDRLARRK